MKRSLEQFGAFCLRSLVRGYLRHFPLSKGKSWAWDRMRDVLKRRPDLFSFGTTSTRNGNRMVIHFPDWHERNLFFWGTWGAPEIEQAISRLLRPGDIFLDIGCNIGYFTLLGAQRVGPMGQVIAFEPSPLTCGRCRRNIDLNGYMHVTLHQKAVSNVTGFATLHQPRAGCDLATLREDAGTVDPDETLRFTVETVCLNTFLAPETKKNIRLVKIDVEGAEFKVLEGMREVLSPPWAPDVICEVNDAFLRGMGAGSAELIGLLRQLGYHVFRFDANGLSPVDVPAGSGAFDIYCTKNRGTENPLFGTSPL